MVRKYFGTDGIRGRANGEITPELALKVGQAARVTADIYGSSVVFRGRVAGVSAGTGAAFALLPPQNASGNWPDSR